MFKKYYFVRLESDEDENGKVHIFSGVTEAKSPTDAHMEAMEKAAEERPELNMCLVEIYRV